jgi:hypothetical protein
VHLLEIERNFLNVFDLFAQKVSKVALTDVLKKFSRKKKLNSSRKLPESSMNQFKKKIH